MKTWAIRKTWDNKFQLCEIETSKCCHGETRNFSRTVDLKYAKESFAIKKGQAFYASLYGEQNIVFAGVLEQDQYTGELAIAN